MGTLVVRNSTLRSHYELVERVINAMKSQLDQPLSLHDLARIGFASPSHFIRTFRQLTGVPPSQFLYALRLDMARRLLMQTQQKVIDICYDVGYNSVGTFTRRFTDLLGISPTTFRELTQGRTIGLREPAGIAPVSAELPPSGLSVPGHLSVPAGFNGLLLAGLFESPVPQGRPLACSFATVDGFYQIDNAPEGDYYLFAVGLADPIDTPAYFHYESALRAGGHQLRLSRKGVTGSTCLKLRPASPFDPPILLVLSLLIDRYLNRSQDDFTPGLLLPPESGASPRIYARDSLAI